MPHCGHEPHKQQAGPNSGVAYVHSDSWQQGADPAGEALLLCDGASVRVIRLVNNRKAALAATQPSENNSTQLKTCQPGRKMVSVQKNTGHQTLAQQRDVFTQIMRRKQGDHDVRGEFSNGHESQVSLMGHGNVGDGGPGLQAFRYQFGFEFWRLGATD